MIDARRVLIVRPSALGDVCRSVPVLASLRRAFPKAQIDWLVQDTFAPAIAAHPALDEVVPFPRSRFGGWAKPWIWNDIRRWGRELRSRGYDLVFDFQGLGRSGLMTWVTRAPRRVGFAGSREFAWLGCNVRHPRPEAPHSVDQMLGLLEAEGIEPVRDLSLYAAPEDLSWWREVRAARGVTDERYAVLAPTTRWESKRWPIERWAALAEPLLERGYERLIVTGTAHERDQAAGLVPDDPRASEIFVNLVGEATIGQTMAAISRAGLVIACDSAPLHMAVGFGRPCVGLFGPTEPAEVGPYGRTEAVVRAYDSQKDGRVNYRDRTLGDRLMQMIKVDDVLAKINQIEPAATPATFSDPSSISTS